MISEDELDDDIILGDDAAEGGDGILYEHFRIVADQGQVALRIDKFLTEHMQHSSRNRIQQAARAGFIHVPFSIEQAAAKPGGTPSLPLAVITQALALAAEAIAENPQDIHESMGSIY